MNGRILQQVLWSKASHVGLCLFIGLGLYSISFKSWWHTSVPVGLILASIATFMLPPINEAVFKLRIFFNRRMCERMNFASVIVAVSSSAYLLLATHLNNRPLSLEWHDEFSYALQTTMLAHGKLWMPSHPLGDAFESFHVMVEPVYASVYFPGTALFHILGKIIHLPYWVIPAIMAGAVAGLLFRIVGEVTEPFLGLLATLLLLAIPLFDKMSTMLLSVMPVTLLVLALFLTWLRWQESNKLRWIFLIGVILGWAAITRPLDAFTAAIPVGCHILWKLKKSPKQWFKYTGLLLVGASPFFAIQGCLNLGTTGNLLQTPYQQYLRNDQPGIEIGFHQSVGLKSPKSRIPQKRQYYTDWMVGEINTHQVYNLLPLLFSRLRETISAGLPARFLIIFIAFALVQPRDSRILILWAMLPLFFLGYIFNTFYLTHYTLVLLPIFVSACVLGQANFANLFQKWPSLNKAVASGLLGGDLFIFLWMCPYFHPIPERDANEYKLLKNVQDLMSKEVISPALVFFRYSETSNFHEEPVYNSDVIWPDEANIIRLHARDRAGNRESIEYYALRQPQRNVYVYDRVNDTLSSLGPVTQVLARGTDEEIPTWNNVPEMHK